MMETINVILMESSHWEIKQLLSGCYSQYGIQTLACHKALEIMYEKKAQHKAEKIQYNAALPWWDFRSAYLAMQSVFIDSSKTYPRLCEKAIRLVNNGSLYWKLRAE